MKYYITNLLDKKQITHTELMIEHITTVIDQQQTAHDLTYNNFTDKQHITKPYLR